MPETTITQVGLPIGKPLPGSTDNGGPGVPVTGKPVKRYGVERSMVDSRWCVYGPRGEALCPWFLVPAMWIWVRLQ